MDFRKLFLTTTTLVLFLTNTVIAGDFYWVGNTGNWNNPIHWANSSGGIGGAGVPSKSDNIIIDINSFTTSNQTINFNGTVAVNNLRILSNNITLTSVSSTIFNIYGSLDAPKTFKNKLEGEIHFKGNSTLTNLDFGWGNWNVDVFFEQKGNYILQSPLQIPNNNFHLIKGTLNLNSNDLNCSSFNANSPLKKSLASENSTIVVSNNWVSSPSKFDYNFSNTNIIIKNSDKNAISQNGGNIDFLQNKGPNDKLITVVSMVTDTASCGDICDGIIIVNFSSTCPTGARVNWSPGTPQGDDDGANLITTGSDTIFNLCPGIEYTAFVTNDCDGDIKFPKATVLGHSRITEAIPASISQPSCNGDCDGSILAFIDAAGFVLTNNTLSYQWTPGGATDTTNTISNLCAGNYSLNVQDGYGCDTTFVYNVTQPDSVHANVTVTDASCFGDCSASATANPTGGNGGFLYSWTPATGNPLVDSVATFSNLCAGSSYTVTVIDSKGCTNDTTIIPGQAPQIQVDTSSTNITCGGDCDGTITVTVLSGGSAPFTHNWSTGTVMGGLSSTISNLCPGQYSDTIIDAFGCDTIFTFNITEPTILTTTTTPTDLTCNGICDGMATTVPVGGAGGYTYSWDCGASTFDSITNLCPTTQCIVTVTDVNLCTVQDTFSISEPLPITVNASSTNVTCPGFNDGTATCSPTGGTGNPATNFTYSWTGPACSAAPYTTQTINSLCPGQYIVTVTDSAGCTAMDTVEITEPLPMNLTMSFTDETCFGSCDGTASVSTTGGTGTPAIDFTYFWTSVPAGQVSTGQGTNAISGLCAGVYTVNITDSVGCPSNASVTVNPKTPIVDNLVKTDLSCNGVCNGTATVSPTGGLGPYTVSWDGAAGIAVPIAGSNTITNLCAGAHTALITDANNCTLLIPFNIIEPPLLTASTSGNDLSCFGICDGDATAVAGGGSGPYTYVWNTIPATAPINGNPINALCAGTYYVTITDDSLCTAQDTVVINEPSEIFPNADSTNITCNGLNNGTAVSIPTGGVPGYSFNWTGPGGPYTTQSISSLSAGQYIITVTDTNNCTGIDTINIIDPPVLTVSANATAASCGAICDGIALATPTGGTPGYTYSWNTNPTQTSQSATGLCAGTYTVTVTDTNGCTAQDTTVINNLIVIQINPSIIGISCNGICDGTATAVPSGGVLPYSYQWFGNSTGPNDTLATANDLCPGWVYVTVTDANGCASTDSINMPVAPPVLVPNGSIDQQISCNNACDAMVSSSPTGGTAPYSVVWTIPNGVDTNNVCPPYAVVTVTDANNCIQSDTLYITEPDTISANATLVHLKCNGDNDGSISLNPTGGTPGYQYLWGAPGNQTTSSITNLTAGTYSVTITDTNGCSKNEIYIINEPALFSSIPIGVDVSCNGLCDGMMAVTIGGGTPPYTYTWANNQPIPPASQDTLFNVCAPFLTNSVTVTDSNGCLTTQTITINEPALLSVNVTGTPIGCSSNCDGTALSTPTGGVAPYSYQWSANAAPNSLTGSGIVNLCADTFNVIVTDTNGCTSNGSYIVTTPPLLAVTLDSTNVTCNGFNNGTGLVTPTGGTPPYTYSWVGGCLTGTNTNPGVSSLCPGIYTVTVTDSANCIFIGSINITEPDPLDDNEVVIDANCGVTDGSIIVFPSGGTPAYTHSWSNGVTNQNNPNLLAGFYTDTITDANGCVGIFTIAISNPTGPSGVTTTVNDATCYGNCDGSFNVIPIGGTPSYTYVWTGPNGFTGTDSTETGLCAGNYNLTLTDAANCILASTIVIGQSDSITANSTFTDATCNGSCDGTASVTPTGGTAPFTYLWSHNGSTASSASGLCVGPVNVTITDFLGCTKVVSFNISSPNILVVTTTKIDALCNGSNDGTATANPVGGTAPFTYQWNDPLAQTNQTATGLSAGTYIVTVTDFNGCSQNSTIIISEPALISPNEVTTLATCGACDGTATVAAASGGIGPYTYLWPSLGATTPNVNALCAGTYMVEITDANLCTQSFPIAISNVNGPIVSVNTTNASCDGVCDGQATAAVTSGTPTYQFLWQTGGQTTATVTGLCADNYTVQVTDGNGCITVEPVVITDNTAITATVTTIDATCNGTCNGSALVVPNGGVPPYNYSWVGGNAAGQTINAVGGLCAGNYTVTISDALGCSLIQNITINESNVLSVTANGIAANCNGSCDGQATAVPNGGTAPFTYTWSTGATTPTITALCAGSYSVTITDINGCTANTTVTIGEGIAITAVTNVTDATCGTCDGTASITASGGSGAPYNYVWSPGGQTTQSLSNLCPGSYSIDVTDNVGCTQSFTILVNNPNGPSLTTLADSVTCFGSCDGLAYTNVTAGNPNYNFQWDDPLLQTNDSATGLCAGLYNVVVQDALGCISVDSVTVLEPQQIIANITFTDPSCPTVCDGTATINPTGGVGNLTILWGASAANQTSLTATNLCAGTHLVTITDSKGCSITDSVTLTDPTNISITISSTPVACNGDCNGTAIANASGGTPGYTYSWNTLPIQNNSLAAGLCPGTYIVTVTDNKSCTDTASVIVIDPPLLTTVSTPSSLSCNNVCDGSISTAPNGGVAPYSYIWNTGDTTQTISNLCAGTYNVTVIDANNCTVEDTIILAAPAILNDSTIITGPTCGACDGMAISTPFGGVGPFNFVWTDPLNPVPALQTDLNVASSNIAGLCAGTINLQITDLGTGCIYDYTKIINSITGPTLALTSTDETCPNACDGTATATPTAGNPPYTYNWTVTGPPSITTQTATGLCVGFYTVTVTDSLNCVTSDTVSINTSGLNLAITSVVPESCFGNCDGSATVAVGAGTSPFNYLWNPTAQITPQATGLCAGNYLVTVTDDVNCSDSISTTISGPSELTVSANINTPISCNAMCDGAVIAVVLGGSPNYSYSWNDPLNQTTQIATGLCAGTYIVNITDDNGCTTADTIILSEPTPILANESITTPACNVCDGVIAVSPTGGFGPYTYLWNTPTAPPSPQPVTATINNLCAGAYAITITDSTGCTSNFNFPLSNTNAPDPNTSVTNISCNGVCDGAITSTPTGGTTPYSYFWSPSGNTTTTITGLCAGLYNLSVTDSLGCVGIATDSIIQPDVLLANINSANITCNGACDGWAVSNVLGGTSPFTYDWTPGNLTTDSIINLCANTYIVTVTDSNNCTASDSVTISEPTLITSTSTQNDVSCSSMCDGTATVTPAGGTGPYTYQWNGNVTPGQAATETGLCFGLATVEIFDQNGCSIIDSISIGAIDTVFAVASPDDTICVESNVNIYGIATGMVDSVAWYQLPSMTQIGSTDTVNITSSTVGFIDYVYTAYGLCSESDTVRITFEALPVAEAGTDVTIIEGQSTTLSGSGGGTYSWNPGTWLNDSTVANPVATPEVTTTYFLTVTSAKGCTDTDSVIVTVLPKITIPDGITPNGDGKNDTWVIDLIEEYPDAVVEIYNRWGVLLFHAEDYKQDWAGTYNGEDLPIGTYYYIIELNDEETEPFTGPITVLR